MFTRLTVSLFASALLWGCPDDVDDPAPGGEAPTQSPLLSRRARPKALWQPRLPLQVPSTGLRYARYRPTHRSGDREDHRVDASKNG